MKKTITIAAALVAVAITLVLLTYSHSSLTGPREAMDSLVLRKLEALGREALKSNDVPVAALLLYGDSIVGKGFNTVIRDSNASGHAEMNAITDGLRRIGYDAFRALKRDSLRLISTLEPCLMCRGALLEYHIHRVEFLKKKPILHSLKEDLRAILYHWRIIQNGPEAVQDSLFRHHPAYRADDSRR